jgi:hypothetical protein
MLNAAGQGLAAAVAGDVGAHRPFGRRRSVIQMIPGAWRRSGPSQLVSLELPTGCAHHPSALRIRRPDGMPALVSPGVSL